MKVIQAVVNFFKGIVRFIRESIEELKKVTWLSKEQAFNSAIVVIVFVLFFSGLLFLIDAGVRFLIDLLVKGGVSG